MANEVEIRITAHDLTGPAFTGITSRVAALNKALNAAFRDRVLNVDTAAALAKIEALKKAADGIRIGGIDMTRLGTDLIALRQKMQSLGIADIADINMQPGRLMTQMQLLKRLAEQAGISDLLDFNVKSSDLVSQLAKIHGISETIPITYKVSGIPHIPGMGSANISDRFSIQGLDAAAAQLAATRVQTKALADGFVSLETAKDSLSGDIDSRLLPSLAKTATATALTTRAFGGWWGILGGSIGGIALWHVALDGALEAAVSLGLAVTDLTIGMAAMAPTAQDIYTHLQAVQTVNSALGTSIPPLTGKFDALATAMAPQTIEAYGGALNFLNIGSGALARTAAEVVTGIDDLVARLDLWRSAQNSTGTALQTGMGYLHQFEGILGSLGGAITNLVKADPGTAHYLLDIVGAAARLLDVATRLPTPFLFGALAFHSFMIWGGAAIGVLSKLPGPLGAAGKAAAEAGGHFGAAVGALRLMATSPWGWAAAGAAALAALAYEGTQADAATKGFIGSLNAQLASENASTAILQIATDMGTVQQRMQGLSQSDIAQKMGVSWTTAGYQLAASGHEIVTAFTRAGSALGFFVHLGDAAKDLFTTGGASALVYQHDIGALNAELDSLVGKQKNLFAETGVLMKQGFSYAQSLALMDLAGVQAGDSFKLMNQKVDNLITGYKNLGVAGGALSNAVNAVTFASLQQQSKVQSLNQGWDAFIATITGGASAFVTFGQDLATLNTDAKAAGASMTGLNANSLTLQGGFLSAASAANSQMDSLTTLASAAGLGSQGTNLLTQANKDLVAAMLPAAGHSSTMTTVLYALAQRGGYTGADSFKALSQWVGNTASPMQNLQGIVGTLTKAAGNLTQDVQNLSTALGTTLNDAMATAIFDASGGQKTFDNFATAILKTGINSDQTKQSGLKLAEAMYGLTGNVSSARGEFETFAQKALGLTKQQADTLWQHDLPGLQNYINSMHGKNLPITANNSQAIGAINQVQAYLNGLHNRTVYATVVQQVQVENTIPVRGGIGGGALRAVGGIVGNVPHAASGGVRNGLTLVGELGPEFVRLPAGSQVYPHNVTPGYASQGSGGNGGTFQFEIVGGQTQFEQFMGTFLREFVRIKGGGNVQKALGRNG